MKNSECPTINLLLLLCTRPDPESFNKGLCDSDSHGIYHLDYKIFMEEVDNDQTLTFPGMVIFRIKLNLEHVKSYQYIKDLCSYLKITEAIFEHCRAEDICGWADNFKECFRDFMDCLQKTENYIKPSDSQREEFANNLKCLITSTFKRIQEFGDSQIYQELTDTIAQFVRDAIDNSVITEKQFENILREIETDREQFISDLELKLSLISPYSTAKQKEFCTKLKNESIAACFASYPTKEIKGYEPNISFCIKEFVTSEIPNSTPKAPIKFSPVCSKISFRNDR